MRLSVIVVFLLLWANVEVSPSQYVCSRPPEVPHAFVSEETIKLDYQGGDVIYFTCEPGYTSSQTSKYVCSSEGWLAVHQGTCYNPLGCERPPPLTDGDTKESFRVQYRHNERVEYVCQNYYVMEGQPYKTCNNGEWTGQMRCLRPCTVNTEDMSRHNIAFYYASANKLYLEHNDVIQFKCVGQRRPDGIRSMRQRCVDGVMQLPTCL